MHVVIVTPCLIYCICSLLSKINWSRLRCLRRFLHEDQDGNLKLIKKPLFEIPLSILDICYTQALMWWVKIIMMVVIIVTMLRLGFFFCPYLPLITIATLVLHFYVRRVRNTFHHIDMYIFVSCDPIASTV